MMISSHTDISGESNSGDAPIDSVDGSSRLPTAASSTASSVNDESTKSPGTDAASPVNVMSVDGNAVNENHAERGGAEMDGEGIFDRDEDGNPISPEQRRALLDEQRKLYEDIAKEKAANDEAIARLKADDASDPTGEKSGPSAATAGRGVDAVAVALAAGQTEAQSDEGATDGTGDPTREQPKKETARENKEETAADAPKDRTVDPSFQHDAEKFNVALESLETMRKLNLEVEFSSSSLAFPVHHDKCTYCQREALHKFINKPPEENGNAVGERGINIGKVKLDGSRLRRFRSNVGGLFEKPPAADAGAAKSCPPSSAPPSTLTSPQPPEENGIGIAAGERGINIGKVKLDGSRLRRFRTNVGGLFEKPPAADAAAAKSCPPSLASPSTLTSMESMESVGEESTTGGSTPNNNKRAGSRRNPLKKQPRPCLTCGHPTCAAHSSSTFSKNNIPICQPCAYLFELDFLVDIIASSASNAKECRRKVDHLVDCYDRAKLLLVFAAKYADEVAAALETRTERSNKIGAGSSATGIVSGVAGVVGCGVLLFPPVAAAGVPLLIASLVFGGGATAVQTGDAAARYFSEPDRLAEKMVALHGMALSLLRITEVLSYALLKNVNVNYSVEGFSEDGEGGEGEAEARQQREALAKEIHELLTKHGVNTTQAGVGGLQSAVLGGIVATEVVAAGSVAAAETTAAMSAGAAVRTAGVVGRNTRYIGRVGTTAASGARFIPIAGGLLSAACVYVEGRELKKTLSRIGEGNPCEKAEQVRSIRDEVDMLPDSSVIAAECHRVFEMARRQEEVRRAAEGDGVKQQDRREKLTLEDVNAGDIADMISVMETSTTIDGMKENAAET